VGLFFLDNINIITQLSIYLEVTFFVKALISSIN